MEARIDIIVAALNRAWFSSKSIQNQPSFTVETVDAAMLRQLAICSSAESPESIQVGTFGTGRDSVLNYLNIIQPDLVNSQMNLFKLFENVGHHPLYNFVSDFLTKHGNPADPRIFDATDVVLLEELADAIVDIKEKLDSQIESSTISLLDLVDIITFESASKYLGVTESLQNHYNDFNDFLRRIKDLYTNSSVFFET